MVAQPAGLIGEAVSNVKMICQGTGQMIINFRLEKN